MSADERTRARVLLTVKAAPEIGRTHGETVCVAGIRLDDGPPRWIRLFPVQRRWFFGQAHPKYQVVEVDVVKHHRDQRPESHRPDLDSAKLIAEPLTRSARAEVLNALPQMTMCDLQAQKGWDRPSLALVVPAEVMEVTAEDHGQNASHARKMMLAAQGSFDEPSASPLEFPTTTYRFRYRCLDPACSGRHHQSIVDWELSESWRKWRSRYADVTPHIQAKWMGLVEPRWDPAFFVGNQQQAPDGWLVLGVAKDITPALPAAAGPRSPGAPRSPSGGNRKGQPQSTADRLFE